MVAAAAAPIMDVDAKVDEPKNEEDEALAAAAPAVVERNAAVVAVGRICEASRSCHMLTPTSGLSDKDASRFKISPLSTTGIGHESKPNMIDGKLFSAPELKVALVLNEFIRDEPISPGIPFEPLAL